MVRGDPQAIGPQLRLLKRLFSRDIENPFSLGRQAVHDLEEKGRFSNAWIAPTSIMDPGTTPPPRTRSNSPIPV